MNEAAVLDFLKNHPEFVLTHAKVLGVQPNNEKITAFAEVKLQANEIRTQRMEQHLNNIIEHARQNQALIDTLFVLDHGLIAATNIDDLTAALHQALSSGFQLPQYALKLAPKNPMAVADGLLLNPNSPVFEKFSQLRQSHCDHYLADEVLTWLPPSNDTMQSFLKMPLFDADKHFIGILIVASPNADHFGPEQDTHYMDNLAQNLSAALNRILNLPNT